MSHRNSDAKIYVGNLPDDIRERDLEDLFYKYGKVMEVDLHASRGTPFAFLEFEDPRDAEDAIRGRDGYMFDGVKLRVEFPRSSGRGDGYRSRGYGGRGGGRSGYRGGRQPRGHQLLVSGLPPSGSWQDIKDHFRQAGDVIYADVTRDGEGVVEFARHDHAKRALRDLDDSKFRSHEGDTAYIRVKEPRSSRSRSRSYSYSPQRSPRRSRRSPVYNSRDSRSPSPRHRSRSNSRD